MGTLGTLSEGSVQRQKEGQNFKSQAQGEQSQEAVMGKEAERTNPMCIHKLLVRKEVRLLRLELTCSVSSESPPFRAARWFGDPAPVV